VPVRTAIAVTAQGRFGMARGGPTFDDGRPVERPLAEGRYFIDAEDQAAQNLAVIGADIRDELFGPLDPIGREMLVSGAPYKVVGVLAKQGRTLGQSRDTMVFVPAQTYRRQFGTRSSLSLLVKARGGMAGLNDSIDEVRAVMRARRHTAFRAPDPFGIVTAESLQELWTQITAAAFILSLLIASVSLGVGGIVIMNIMLVAVVERTREIGVRLALGARKKDIRRQFLLESALLSLVGGIVGVVLAGAATLGVRNLLEFPAQMTPPIVALGIALSIGVGGLAGYWPARSASNLPVVDSLRTE
jgi:putative ABC transport system permease protein